MSDPMNAGVDRREFLQAGVAAGAALTAATGLEAVARTPDDTKKKADATAKLELPRRVLGKTGEKVTILNLGTWQSPGVDRLLRFAYASGVRYFDTADCYGSEPAIARWLKSDASIRKNIFLATKDHPRQGPQQLIEMLDARLQALQTDYVDLFFIHGIGPREYQGSLDWIKGKEFAAVVDKIKKSGKAKYIGFSCHDGAIAQYVQAAADANIVDAIMIRFTAWLNRDTPLNKALDDCHKKNIGIVSMKQVAGQTDKILQEVPKRMPELKERGMTPYMGLLHAIWSDERISSCCVSMRNTDQIRQNTLAARKYEPMHQASIMRLRDACLAAGPTFCADCDGRCSHAAGTQAALGDLTRLLTYHDQYGYRGKARELYANLPESDRDWSGADLEAAQRACPSNLDFAALLPRVKDVLA